MVMRVYYSIETKLKYYDLLVKTEKLGREVTRRSGRRRLVINQETRARLLLTFV